jgi:hypothetical protein
MAGVSVGGIGGIGSIVIQISQSSTPLPDPVENAVLAHGTLRR